MINERVYTRENERLVPVVGPPHQVRRTAVLVADVQDLAVAHRTVHGAPVTLHLEDLWIKDVTMNTGARS